MTIRRIRASVPFLVGFEGKQRESNHSLGSIFRGKHMDVLGRSDAIIDSISVGMLHG